MATLAGKYSILYIVGKILLAVI